MDLQLTNLTSFAICVGYFYAKSTWLLVSVCILFQKMHMTLANSHRICYDTTVFTGYLLVFDCLLVRETKIPFPGAML